MWAKMQPFCFVEVAAKGRAQLNSALLHVQVVIVALEVSMNVLENKRLSFQQHSQTSITAENVRNIQVAEF